MIKQFCGDSCIVERPGLTDGGLVGMRGKEIFYIEWYG